MFGNMNRARPNVHSVPVTPIAVKPSAMNEPSSDRKETASVTLLGRLGFGDRISRLGGHRRCDALGRRGRLARGLRRRLRLRHRTRLRSAARRRQNARCVHRTGRRLWPAGLSAGFAAAAWPVLAAFGVGRLGLGGRLGRRRDSPRPRAAARMSAMLICLGRLPSHWPARHWPAVGLRRMPRLVPPAASDRGRSCAGCRGRLPPTRSSPHSRRHDMPPKCPLQTFFSCLPLQKPNFSVEIQANARRADHGRAAAAQGFHPNDSPMQSNRLAASPPVKALPCDNFHELSPSCSHVHPLVKPVSRLKLRAASWPSSSGVLTDPRGVSQSSTCARTAAHGDVAAAVSTGRVAGCQLCGTAVAAGVSQSATSQTGCLSLKIRESGSSPIAQGVWVRPHDDSSRTTDE